MAAPLHVLPLLRPTAHAAPRLQPLAPSARPLRPTTTPAAAFAAAPAPTTLDPRAAAAAAFQQQTASPRHLPCPAAPAPGPTAAAVSPPPLTRVPRVPARVDAAAAALVAPPSGPPADSYSGALLALPRAVPHALSSGTGPVIPPDYETIEMTAPSLPSGSNLVAGGQMPQRLPMRDTGSSGSITREHTARAATAPIHTASPGPRPPLPLPAASDTAATATETSTTRGHSVSPVRDAARLAFTAGPPLPSAPLSARASRPRPRFTRTAGGSSAHNESLASGGPCGASPQAATFTPISARASYAGRPTVLRVPPSVAPPSSAALPAASLSPRGRGRLAPAMLMIPTDRPTDCCAADGDAASAAAVAQPLLLRREFDAARPTLERLYKHATGAAAMPARFGAHLLRKLARLHARRYALV